LAKLTEYYSGSDIKSVCHRASMISIRKELTNKKIKVQELKKMQDDPQEKKKLEEIEK